MADRHQDPERVRVASLPGGRSDLARVIDPTVIAAVTPAGSVGPAWAEALAALVDVVHVHVGLDGGSPVQQAAAMGTVLAQQGIPLAVTVHDVPMPSSHAAVETAALVKWARVVIAPHGCAAGEVHRYWGRRARVVPAPSVASDDEIRHWMTTRVRGTAPRIGICGADRDMDRATGLLRGLRPDADVDLGHADLSVPAAVMDWVAAHDLVVLPPGAQARGAWIELARDVATGIVVPVGPTEGEPRALATYVRSSGPGSMARAAAAAVGNLAAVERDPDRRIAAGVAVRDLHTGIYRELATADREGHDGPA